MRPRIPYLAQSGIERVQQSRGCDISEATRLVIDAGLRSLGALPAAPPLEHQVCDDAEVTAPLPGAARAAIKRLAKTEYRSNRAMTRQIILVGLKALGAWPPAEGLPASPDTVAPTPANGLADHAAA
jgi:hypothetical protein